MTKITQVYGEGGIYIPRIHLEGCDLEDLRTILESYIDRESKSTRHAVPSVTLSFARKLQKQLR